MASTAKFSYLRLKHEGGGSDDDDVDDQQIRLRVIGRAKSWSRLRKVHLRRRLRVRIPSLKRFLRRKARLVVVSCAKILKRLKESQAHLGDLFAGNYLFMQVTPTPMNHVDRSLKAYPHHHQDFRGISSSSSSRFSVPRIAQ